MKIRVLIVDDDQHAIQLLKSYLKAYAYIEVVGTCNHGEAAMDFMRNHPVDLLFLDIEMDGINGLQLAKHLQSIYPEIMIIFVTGHAGFALKGYESHPVDFLTKPVNVLRLEKALNRVKELKSSTPVAAKDTNHKIGMKVDGGIHIVHVHNIIYIQKKGRKILIHCRNGEVLHSNDTMKNLETIFSAYDFYRPHQSFIVPLEQIKAIFPDAYSRSYSIQLTDDPTLIPLSRDKYQELKDLLLSKGVAIY